MLDLIYDRTAEDVAAGDTAWVPTWLQGTLGASGQQVNSTTRCRTGGFQQFSASGGLVGIYVPPGWKMSGRRYTTAAASGFDQTFPTGAWIRGTYILEMPPGRFYRFVLAREDDATLDPTGADASGVTFTIFNVKGRYNNTDLNRVETAVGQLVAMLNAAGWSLSLTTKTDWAAASEAAPAQDIPTATDMARYLANVAAIRHALAFYRTTPPAPDSMELLTWQKANAIERILADAEELINNMLASRCHSGELYAGEGFGAPSVKDFDGSVAEFGGGIAGAEISPFITRISHNGMTAARIAVTKKNMLLRPYIHDDTFVTRGITFTVQDDGTIKASGTLSGTDQPYHNLRRIWLQPGVIYSISHGCDHPRAFCVVYFRNYADTQTITPTFYDVDYDRAVSKSFVSTLNNNVFRAKRTFYVNEPCVIEFQIRFSPASEAQTVTDAVFKPMLYIGGENDDWDTAPTWEQATGEIITIPFGTAVDKGTLNVTTGELTVTQPSAATYQLTPTAVTMLDGYNQIVSDTGAVAFSLKGVID